MMRVAKFLDNVNFENNEQVIYNVPTLENKGLGMPTLLNNRPILYG